MGGKYVEETGRKRRRQGKYTEETGRKGRKHREVYRGNRQERKKTD